MSSPTPNLGLTYPAHGGAVGAWDAPLNTDFDTIDTAIGGTVTVAAAGSGATLTQTQANNKRISVTGVLSQNYLMTFPAIGGEWVVSNDTTGNFTVTANVVGSAVTPLTITQSASTIVSSNGTNLYQAQSSSNTWAGATYAGTDISPTSFSTSQNDYSPTNLSTATCLRLNVTAACSLTGITGGAAGRDLELINVGTATLKCPANSTSTAANQFANTFNLAPSQSIFLRYDATSSRWRPKNIATAFSSCAAAYVSGDLLVVNHTGTENTKLDITASEAVLVDASGNGIKFENISVSIDSTTTGVGGCDISTRQPSTSYFGYLVSDGTNINAMISTSATSPSLTNAANYIYYKRINWQRTDGSSNFQRIRTMWRRGQYVVSSAITTAMPLIASGIAGTHSATAPTFAAVSVSNFVPSTAIAITIAPKVHYNVGTPSFVYLAPNSNYSGSASTNPAPYYSGDSSGATSSEGGPVTFVLESTNVSWVSSAAGGALFCLGWEDNI